MIVNLVRTTSSDGVKLHGAFHATQGEPRPDIGVDAVICLHGVGSNFYGSTLMEDITPRMLELGVAVLWVNTRGHDGLNTAIATGQRRRQGAAYEIVDECRHDVSAWSDYLVQRGLSRLVLLGHSLGAIKAVYSQALQPLDSVVGVLALSPPRLSYSAFINGPSSAEFFQAITQAERHVDEGSPETLIEVDFPFPLVITAGGYVDKYGRQERYNILKFAHQVSCPILFCYGELELERGGVAFAGLPKALTSLAWQCDPYQVVEIAGADHVYRGRRSQLAAKVARWLDSTFQKP